MLISQLLYKRCSLSCPSVLAQKTAKYKKLFFRFFSNTQARTLISQPLYKRCSLSCPLVLAQKRQNMRNYFFVFFSNTQARTLISQPLYFTFNIHMNPMNTKNRPYMMGDTSFPLLAANMVIG